MWHILMVLSLASLAGLYATFDKPALAAYENVDAVNLVRDMAHYREAVIAYFAQNPGVYPRADITALLSANVWPSWSTLQHKHTLPRWAHYRDSDGMLYVYAASEPDVNLFPELMKLTQNSVLVGVYRAGDTTLYSPVLGDTGRKLPTSGSAAIPVGSPVWIAVDR
ncbi:MAG TPA: type IV pilus biogenesis protein PilM [Noviherbaspirillum sp.]|nr:type IV pilus biogenesis protein PilM [Noviherbaspirillum sp.]